MFLLYKMQVDLLSRGCIMAFECRQHAESGPRDVWRLCIVSIDTYVYRIMKVRRSRVFDLPSGIPKFEAGNLHFLALGLMRFLLVICKPRAAKTKSNPLGDSNT